MFTKAISKQYRDIRQSFISIRFVAIFEYAFSRAAL